MIALKNLNIKFDYTIIEDSELEIYPNKITLICGKSGSGKTSVLNVLGLLDNISKRDYYLNGKQLNDKDITNLQRFSFSYVFQDYNLLEDLSVEDNFRVSFNFLGRKFCKKEMHQLLKKVSLNYSQLPKKAKSLSGGEKQRLAIALALIKKPSLLLLDEPTANLDEKNTHMIIDILNQLKSDDLMVVISTHHPEIYNSDVIYQIENKKLLQIKNNSFQINNNHDDNKKSYTYKWWNIILYSCIHMVHHWILYGIFLIILCCSMFQIAIKIPDIISEYEMIQDSFDIISSNEIFVNHVSTYLNEEDKYYYGGLGRKVISNETLTEMQSIKHIKSLYPYYAVSSQETDCTKSIDELNNHSWIKYKDKKINLFEDYGQLYYIVTCDSKEKEKKSILIDEQVEKGIYISNHLADLLGIKSLNHTKISLQIPIILGHYNTQSWLIYDDGTESEPINTENYMHYKKEMTLEIKGIYEKTGGLGYYNLYGGEEIYIDFQDYHNLTLDLYNDENFMNTYKEAFNQKKSRDIEVIPEYEWASSSYIVEVEDIDYIEEVKDEIEKLDNGNKFFTKTNAVEKDKITSLANHYNTSIYLEIGVIMGVTLVLFCIIYIYILYQRKKEIAYLKANGLQNAHLYPIVDILILSFISILIVYIMLNIWLVLDGLHLYRFEYQFLHLCTTVLLIIICFVINVVFYRKLDIIKELRSK